MISRPLVEKPRWPRPINRLDCIERYGPVIHMENLLSWPDQKKWLARWPFPRELAIINGLSGSRATGIYCNKDLHEPLSETFRQLIGLRLIHEIKTFDGCWNLRMSRGSKTQISMHAWGLAVDFNAALMPLGSPSTWSADFVEVWQKLGWRWGGNFKRSDPMHFSWVGTEA